MNHRFRAAASLGLGLLLSLLLVPAAHAHAAYESSDPGNGTTVSSPPGRVTAEFTEPVVDDSRLEVYDPCGTRVDNGDSFVAADRITVSMSADKQGTYRVHFSVVSSVDGHPTSGDFDFTSSGGSPCPGEEPAEEEEPEKPQSPRDDRADDEAMATDDESTGSTDPEDGASRSSRERPDRSEAGHQGHRRTKDDRVAGRRIVAQDETPETEETSTTGIWDGIPMSDFFVALAVATLIGAAGGRIYAGILGPRR